jgi:hypothetical protein
MSDFLSQMDLKLDNLEEFDLSHNDIYNLDEFVCGFTRKLSETVCCPKLQVLRIHFPLSWESMEVVEELRSRRQSLFIYVEQDSGQDSEQNSEQESD